MGRPLIIITDGDGREELLVKLISKFGQKIYAIVLRSVSEVESAAAKLRPSCKEQGVLLLAHADTENIKFCDGIHLNKKSKSIVEVRKAFGRKITIGYSSHSVDEAKRALKDGANYVFLSPVFKSKDGLSKPLGANAFNQAVKEIGPGVFALGGVNSSNVKLLPEDAAGYACISAIFAVEDPFDELERILKVV